MIDEKGLSNKRKPNFEMGKKPKIEDTYEQKLRKIEIYYRYRVSSIYRQMKIPLYEKLQFEKKSLQSKNVKPQKVGKNQSSNNLNDAIESLYKIVCLNSKYHHREKMRFERTPLMKYIEYDFKSLAEKLKNKQFTSIYDDLIQDDEEQKEDENKKQYEKDPQFSLNAINNFKKKNNISGKIVIAEGYDDLKSRLITKYGWTQNKDASSLYYDLKYLSKKKDIDYVNLLDGQMINHFHENKSITAKFGLCRNIRNIVILGKDHSQFFPRCYDVNDVKQLEDFYENFKITHVQRIIDHYLLSKGNVSQSQEKAVQIAIKCLECENLSVQKKINLIFKDLPVFVTQDEWKTLSKYQFVTNEGKKNQNLFEAAQKLQKICQVADPQYYLNKQNIWIVKPASMSRGRGIKTFNDLNQILDYVVGKEISWVVQKYIERPLIIRKKKFDIRQWVLLTDFKPLRVWTYDECYIRFCSNLYEPDNLKDRKIHLTNNSVTKGVNNIEDGILENMMSELQFAEELKSLEGGKDIFQTIIKPQIKRIAIQTLQSIKQNMVSRKNTLEVFGYDFMIDENYKVWLIEVNSSPTMEYSTQTTIKIVKRGMTDLADLIENYMLQGRQYDKENADNLYGGWKLLINQ